MNEQKPHRDLQTVRKFSGTYRSIRYELNELDKGQDLSAFLPRIHWCGYVWLDASRLPEADRGLVIPKARDIGLGSGRHVYTDRDTIWSGAPFHGGCTFVSVLPDPTPGKGPYVQAGCDWNHLWDFDAGFHGAADSVERNCCEVIDWLLERFPWLEGGAAQ
jgi:hypothetical protein